MELREILHWSLDLLDPLENLERAFPEMLAERENLEPQELQEGQELREKP